MGTSSMLELLRSFKSDMPVVIYDPLNDSVNPLSAVYHDAPRTFVQYQEGTKVYSRDSLISRLEFFENDIPFDAAIVSGDDWNFQCIQDVVEQDSAIIIKLDKPVME